MTHTLAVMVANAEVHADALATINARQAQAYEYLTGEKRETASYDMQKVHTANLMQRLTLAQEFIENAVNEHATLTTALLVALGHQEEDTAEVDPVVHEAHVEIPRMPLVGNLKPVSIPGVTPVISDPTVNAKTQEQIENELEAVLQEIANEENAGKA